MATETRIVVTDDLTGGPADNTVEFSFVDHTYEIDLNDDNFRAFYDLMQPYIQAGRTVRQRRAPGAGQTKKTDSTAVRTWARANGWPNLSDKGRLAKAILNAYEARVR